MLPRSIALTSAPDLSARTAATLSTCNDVSEAVELFEPQDLYLKPIGKVTISVQLPALKAPNKTISNWEVMEKLRYMIKPDTFIVLKVLKSNLEFIRFEGEAETKSIVPVIIQRLDGKTIKLSGFPDVLKVRSAEAKLGFPSRHDWDSYFRDAKNMNEIRPGERPDTIHLKDLPSKWFANRKSHSSKNNDQPSEYILRKVFETFGEVRCVDIPMLDPYRKEMAATSSKIQTFTFGQDLLFEAYVQYKEYIAFVKAMSALRGMKLLCKTDGKAHSASIKVDFDKTKHLSDKAIRRRRLERERLEALEKEKEERVLRERKEKEEEERERERKRNEKIERKKQRMAEREQKRKQRQMEKKQMEEEELMRHRIALEERKILIAHRKLQTIRLLSEVFNRLKTIKQQEEVERREQELEEEHRRRVEDEQRQQIEAQRRKLEREKRKQQELENQEKELREKILTNIKLAEEKKAARQREQLRKKISGKVKLKSTVILKKHIEGINYEDSDEYT